LNNNIYSLKDFLHLLDEEGVIYVSWKNNHELNESLAGNKDLDILVDDHKRNLFLELLKKNSWAECKNHVAHFDHIHHFYNVFDNDIYHLHIYFEVITGESWIKEFNLPFKEFIFQNRVKNNDHDIWTLNNKSQAYMFLIRHFLKTGSIFSRILYSIEMESYKQEWSSCNENLENLKSYGPLQLGNFVYESGLEKGFMKPSFLSSMRVRNFFSQYLRISKNLLFLYRLKSLINRLFNKLILKRKKLISNRGLIVAISGPDGSGKTSIIKKLNSELSKHLSCNVYSLGKPQNIFLERVRLFLRKTSSKKSKTSNSSNIKGTGTIKAFLALFLSILRLRMAKRAELKASSGYLVLVDRWPTKSFGKMDSAKIIITTSSNSFLRYLSCQEKRIYESMPKADVCIFLNVSVNTAISRNNERQKEDKETKDEIIKRHKNNQDILPIAKKVINFDNDGELKTSSNNIKKIIFSEIAIAQD